VNRQSSLVNPNRQSAIGIPQWQSSIYNLQSAMDAAQYCREIETYLCRKNEGHLIRIVGPVFEKVTGWAAQGVPLAVAFKGIDAYCERYYAKGPRRRPVRVEFCEADVLELFDGWRRAVGVPSVNGDEGDAGRKQDSLPSHIDRAIARLTALRGGKAPGPFTDRLDEAVRELDRLKASAKQARGDARTAILDRLGALDGALLDLARAQLDDASRAAVRAKAEAEIAPFAARMPADARTAAVEAAFTRLVRESAGLPALTFL
jgi:hypothetical protein